VQTLPPLQLGMGSEAGRHTGDGSKGEVKSQVLWTRLVGVARVYFIKGGRANRPSLVKPQTALVQPFEQSAIRPRKTNFTGVLDETSDNNYVRAGWAACHAAAQTRHCGGCAACLGAAGGCSGLCCRRRRCAQGRHFAAQSLARASEMASVVMPNCLYSTGPGAEAPKVSTPMEMPLSPTYLCQPKVEPACSHRAAPARQDQRPQHPEGSIQSGHRCSQALVQAGQPQSRDSRPCLVHPTLDSGTAPSVQQTGVMRQEGGYRDGGAPRWTPAR